MPNLPGAEGVEVSQLGLVHVENVGRTDTSSPRVHCVSNPCTFQINELVFGVTSHDILFNLSSDETNAKLEPGSRLSRISQNLIKQQSYYPLYPPAKDLSMDLKQVSKMKMPCQPDFLIVPSKLTCFAKPVLDSTLVINPGHLTKDTTGGTYAIMEVHPFLRDDLEQMGGSHMEMQHAVQNRTRVEIRRI